MSILRAGRVCSVKSIEYHFFFLLGNSRSVIHNTFFQENLEQNWWQKNFVTVLDSNESYAAVEPQTLDAESRLIVHTTRPLTDGCIVRLE